MTIELLSILALGFAVSIDSFGVGFIYGLRRISVPLKSLIVIILCTALMVFVSMKIGQLLSIVISHSLAIRLGALILIVIGCWSLFNAYKNRDNENFDNDNVNNNNEPFKIIKLWNIKLGNIAIAIQILKSPEIADIDKSGNISTNEAIVLGLALAFDAFGAGIGSALIGYSIWLTVIIISIMSGLLVYFGIKCGFVLAKAKNIDKLSYLPGCLLVILGLIKIF